MFDRKLIGWGTLGMLLGIAILLWQVMTPKTVTVERRVLTSGTFDHRLPRITDIFLARKQLRLSEEQIIKIENLRRLESKELAPLESELQNQTAALNRLEASHKPVAMREVNDLGSSISTISARKRKTVEIYSNKALMILTAAQRSQSLSMLQAKNPDVRLKVGRQ